MKYLRTTYQGSAEKTVEVQLGPEDAGKTDAQLITAADNQFSYDDPKCHNFGGVVQPLLNGRAKITIYID